MSFCARLPSLSLLRSISNTLPQLEACMQILLELDKSLKSQPVSAQTLLETALCRLAMAGGRR